MVVNKGETLATNEGVSFHFAYMLNGEQYAEGRADAFPGFLHIHARMYKTNRETLKEIRKDIEASMRPIVNEFEYPCFYVVTPHEKLLRMMVKLEYEKVGEYGSMDVFKVIP